MTLVDTNLLVYATFADAPEYPRARAWLEQQFADGGIVLCWPVVYSFLRIVTNRRAFGDRTLTLAAAWADVTMFLSDSTTRVVAAGAGHAPIAAELLTTPGIGSRDVPDVQLAALAIEHGLVLASHDHGFRRFAKLRFVDPLTD